MLDPNPCSQYAACKDAAEPGVALGTELLTFNLGSGIPRSIHANC